VHTDRLTSSITIHFPRSVSLPDTATESRWVYKPLHIFRNGHRLLFLQAPYAIPTRCSSTSGFFSLPLWLWSPLLRLLLRKQPHPPLQKLRAVKVSDDHIQRGNKETHLQSAQSTALLTRSLGMWAPCLIPSRTMLEVGGMEAPPSWEVWVTVSTAP
jgi:hypothetical protein